MVEQVQVRVGDRDRRAADEQLLAAVQDGVLTLAEYDERAALLWQARVRPELDALVADLPGAQLAPRPAAPADASSPAPRPRWVVAVMSEDSLSAPVAPGQDVVGVAVMGHAVLDLHRSDLPSGVRVRAISVMGEIEVDVPPGSVVHLTGLSLMGERTVRVSEGDGPVVHVCALALMGSVKVREGRGELRSGGGTAGGLAPAASRAPANSGSAVADRSGSRRLARRGRLSRIGRALGGSAVSLALLAGVGGVVASGTDQRVVFGSAVHQVAVGEDQAAVSMLFGSVTVVVPNGVRVDQGGLVVFGSVECQDACAAGDGPALDLRTIGAFGSVEIFTVEEYDEEPGRRLGDELDDG